MAKDETRLARIAATIGGGHNGGRHSLIRPGSRPHGPVKRLRVLKETR